MEQTSEKSASYKHRALLIGIGVLLLDIILIFIIFLLLAAFGYGVRPSTLISIPALTFISSYFLAGLYCGKHWHESSWRLGWWLTIPLAVTIILIFPILISSSFTDEGRANFRALFVIYIGICFAAFFSSSIGASFGTSKHRALQIGIGVLLLNIFLDFFIIDPLLLSFGISDLNIFIIIPALTYISSYFLAGLYCGKHWHESSWRLGWWLIIPLAVTNIILYYFIL